MKKYADLLKMQEAYQSNQARIKAEIDALSTAITDCEELMKREAEAGNLESYKRKKAEVEAAKDELFVLRAQVARGPGYDKSDVLEAWKDYAEGRDRELKKKLEKYQKNQKALYEEFLEIVDFQNESLRTRVKVAALAGVAIKNAIAAGPGNAQQFPLEMLENKSDAKYFAAAGLTDKDTEEKIASVVTLQMPKN